MGMLQVCFGLFQHAYFVGDSNPERSFLHELVSENECFSFCRINKVTLLCIGVNKHVGK